MVAYSHCSTEMCVARSVSGHYLCHLVVLKETTSARELLQVGESARRKMVLVGETPSDEEDRQGRPFVGPAGALLDRYTLSDEWISDSRITTHRT
jgi:uracil-DNA glycosylase